MHTFSTRFPVLLGCPGSVLVSGGDAAQRAHCAILSPHVLLGLGALSPGCSSENLSGPGAATPLGARRSRGWPRAAQGSMGEGPVGTQGRRSPSCGLGARRDLKPPCAAGVPSTPREVGVGPAQSLPSSPPHARHFQGARLVPRAQASPEPRPGPSSAVSSSTPVFPAAWGASDPSAPPLLPRSAWMLGHELCKHGFALTQGDAFVSREEAPPHACTRGRRRAVPAGPVMGRVFWGSVSLLRPPGCTSRRPLSPPAGSGGASAQLQSPARCGGRAPSQSPPPGPLAQTSAFCSGDWSRRGRAQLPFPRFSQFPGRRFAHGYRYAN